MLQQVVEQVLAQVLEQELEQELEQVLEQILIVQAMQLDRVEEELEGRRLLHQPAFVPSVHSEPEGLEASSLTPILSILSPFSAQRVPFLQADF